MQDETKTIMNVIRSTRKRKRSSIRWFLLCLLVTFLLLDCCPIHAEATKETTRTIEADASNETSHDDTAQEADTRVDYDNTDADSPINKLPDELPEENGLVLLTSVDSLFAAFKKNLATTNNQHQPMLILIVVYAPTCPYSQDMIQNVEQAAVLASKHIKSLGTLAVPPLFAKIDATRDTWMNEQLETDRVPGLLLVRGRIQQDDIAVDMVDDEGLKSTPSEIFSTVLFNWYRFSLSSLYSMDKDGEERDDAPVFELPSREKLSSFLQIHGSGLLNRAVPSKPPELHATEKLYMDWLLHFEEKADPYYLFAQCRRNEQEPDAYRQYSDLANAMAQRRDVAFFAVSDCTSMDMEEDGEVISWMVDGKIQWNRGDALPHKTALHFSPSDTAKSMTQFVVTHVTPPVLWYDRKTVAPMAFALYRHVHAILFVDMHLDWDVSEQQDLEKMAAANTECVATRRAIRDFRSACKAHSRESLKNLADEDLDMVCLIVPSTETRIMNTFGIDIWTPLDAAVTTKRNLKEDDQVPAAAMLPTLLITDRRFGGTGRYYLEAESIIKEKMPSSIERFLRDFWDNRLTPDLQSQNSAPTVNESGVKILTGDTFEKLVSGKRDKHTLVYFFAPTCGHCKRFSILWNELSRLVRYLEWDSFLELVKMDVTQNEIRGENYLDIQVVPDVYYYPVGDDKQPVRYDIVDELGDGAGRLRDPLDVIDWLLDVSEGMDGLNEEALLKLITDRGDDEEM